MQSCHDTPSSFPGGCKYHPPGSFLGQEVDGKYHPAKSFLGTDGQYHPAGSFLGTDGRYHPEGAFLGTDSRYRYRGSFLGTDGRYHLEGLFLGSDGRYHRAHSSARTVAMLSRRNWSRKTAETKTRFKVGSPDADSRSGTEWPALLWSPSILSKATRHATPYPPKLDATQRS